MPDRLSDATIARRLALPGMLAAALAAIEAEHTEANLRTAYQNARDAADLLRDLLAEAEGFAAAVARAGMV